MSEADSAPHQHRSYAPESVNCWVLTVSDSRSAESDTSGKLIEEKLEAAGHRALARRIVPDEPEAIRTALKRAIVLPEVDAALVTGGTGVSPRDRTPEAVAPLLDKVLDGFGELFRALSYAEIGPAAMLSRAIAGSAGGTAIYVMPGSRAAVALALDRLILPEICHLVGQLRR